VMPCNDRSADLPLLHICCEEAGASSWRCAYTLFGWQESAIDRTFQRKEVDR